MTYRPSRYVPPRPVKCDYCGELVVHESGVFDWKIYQQGYNVRHFCPPVSMEPFNEKDFTDPTPELKAFLELIGIRWIDNEAPDPPPAAANKPPPRERRYTGGIEI